MPKVIHIIRKFEPAEWGGTETHLVALIRELVSLGWESEVHAPEEEGTDGRAIREAGATFRTFRARYPYVGMSRQQRAGLVAAGGNLISVDELVKLTTGRCDMLHVHTLGRLGGVVRTASRLRRIPYAVTLHGPVRANAEVAREDAQRRTRGMLDVGAPFGLAVGARRVVQDADLVFVLNKGEEDAWSEARKNKHLERVAHGVDLAQASAESMTETRALATGLGGARFAVVVARIDRAKGQDIAIRAFASVAPEDLHLVLAGSVSDASFNAELEAQIADLPAEKARRVHLVGGISPAQARAFLAASSVALIPSRAEPFGIVLLEAWAESAVALFSDVGGMADIARKTDGMYGLVPPDDTQAWSSRLSEFFAKPGPADAERSRVRPRVAAHFTWCALAENIVSGYQQSLR